SKIDELFRVPLFRPDRIRPGTPPPVVRHHDPRIPNPRHPRKHGPGQMLAFVVTFEDLAVVGAEAAGAVSELVEAGANLGTVGWVGEGSDRTDGGGADGEDAVGEGEGSDAGAGGAVEAAGRE